MAAPANLNPAMAQAYNLAVLKRLDPDIEEVLASAGHVCLYLMHVDTQQWQRKNVEGSLYLLKRRSNPRFQMIVLNKLTTDNYVEVVHGGLDFELNSPYLMYTHGNSEIHGIWFYEVADLEKMGNILKKIKSALPKADVLPPAGQPVEASASGDGFWDKEVEVPKEVPMKPGMAHGSVGEPSMQQVPTGNKAAAAANLTNLFRQAQLKQQAGTAPAPAPQQPQPQVPSQAMQPQLPAHIAPQPEPPLLPPTFSGAVSEATVAAAAQQAQAVAVAPAPAPAAPAQQPAGVPVNKHLLDLRKAAALSPANSLDAGTAAQDAPNPLQKLFAKAAVPATPPGAPRLQLPAPAAQPQAAAALRPEAATPAQTPTAVISPSEMRQKVRQAFGKLLSNDAFVDMIAVEFKSAGLLH